MTIATHFATYYQGESGRQYYEQRRLSRRTNTQQEAARVFQQYTAATATVLDFGCGTGEVLKLLECGRRMAIEVNELSMREARSNGIEVFASLDDVADGSCDVIISHHALEHVLEPYSILCALHDKLTVHGTIVVVVPFESPKSSRSRYWNPQDSNKHLHNWTPLNLGNLVNAAGFAVLESRLIMKGRSRLIEWLAPVPSIYSLAQSVVFFLKCRGHVLCVGKKDA